MSIFSSFHTWQQLIHFIVLIPCVNLWTSLLSLVFFLHQCGCTNLYTNKVQECLRSDAHPQTSHFPPGIEHKTSRLEDFTHCTTAILTSIIHCRVYAVIEASNAGVTDGQLSTELPDIQLKERVAAVNKLLSAVSQLVTSDFRLFVWLFFIHESYRCEECSRP